MFFQAPYRQPEYHQNHNVPSVLTTDNQASDNLLKYFDNVEEYQNHILFV